MSSIAILADFPIQLVTENLTVAHPPWFSALYLSGVLPEQCTYHWIILDTKEKNSFTLTRKNHYFHIIPQTKLSIGLITGYFSDQRKIVQLLDTIKPDIVHAWGTEHAYAMTASNYSGRKILSMQGILTAYCQRSKMPWFYRIQQFWERKALKKIEYITVESPWGKDRIIEIKPHAEVELIEYGVESSFFKIVKNLSSDPQFLYGGIISDTKGSEALVDCFSKKELSHITLKIAGMGNKSFVKKLKQKASNNIIFMGKLTREELMNELSHTWCLIHPTLADTSPNIVKEARCTGTPVITTPEGGQTQYVIHGKSGYICPVNDVDEMSKAVLSMSESADKCISMGQYGLTECREALAPELTAKKIAELYNRILTAEIFE